MISKLKYTQEYGEKAGLYFQAYLDSISHSLIYLTKKHQLPLMKKSHLCNYIHLLNLL